MTGRSRAWLVGPLALGLAAGVSVAGPEPGLDAVRAVELPAPSDWGQAPQVVGADKAGRVFLLRTETLEVHAVGADLELEKPHELEAGGLPRPSSFHHGAMGEDSGDWLLLGREIRWFVDGREQPLHRAEQPVLGGALAGGEPVLLLEPLRLRMKRGESFSRLPTLARWNDREWVPFFEEVVTPGLGDPSSLAGAQARDAALAVTPGGEVWIASTYAPRLRRLSPAGKVILELGTGEEVAERTVESTESSRAELEELAGKLAAGGRADGKPAHTSVQVMTTEPVHEAIAIDRDGVVYLVVRDPEKRAAFRLRRWDPARFVLEEVALPIDLPGRSTMAAGRDGLHLAHWSASQGRVFVPREELEVAAWREVEGATIDGVAVPADRRSDPPSR